MIKKHGPYPPPDASCWIQLTSGFRDRYNQPTAKHGPKNKFVAKVGGRNAKIEMAVYFKMKPRQISIRNAAKATSTFSRIAVEPTKHREKTCRFWTEPLPNRLSMGYFAHRERPKRCNLTHWSLPHSGPSKERGIPVTRVRRRSPASKTEKPSNST